MGHEECGKKSITFDCATKSMSYKRAAKARKIPQDLGPFYPYIKLIELSM